MNEYAYQELAAAAMKIDATQEEINALGEWFEHYGMSYWNGNCWTVDEKKDICLARVFKEVDEDEFECVGYTFAHEAEFVEE